jgi:hypothetical protein
MGGGEAARKFVPAGGVIVTPAGMLIAVTPLAVVAVTVCPAATVMVPAAAPVVTLAAGIAVVFVEVVGGELLPPQPQTSSRAPTNPVEQNFFKMFANRIEFLLILSLQLLIVLTTPRNSIPKCQSAHYALQVKKVAL